MNLRRAIHIFCAGAFLAPATLLGVSTSAEATGGPCGTTLVRPATYDHVIWIVEEDKTYGTVIGSKYAPYINATLVPACGLATNFHPETHNSLGDYLAMSSGGTVNRTPPTIFGQLQSVGGSWRAYLQSMPGNCYGKTFGDYSQVHNPPVWFNDTKATCATNDVPISALTTDLATGHLPRFAFIAADNAHNMHNNPVSSAVANGDAWLRVTLSQIVASGTYRAGRTAVFVTWDEGNGPKSSTVNYQGENCLDPVKAASDVSCHVATLVIAPSVRPGLKPTTFFSHYSLLRTTEEMLGLPLLGRATTAASMRAYFGV